MIFFIWAIAFLSDRSILNFMYQSPANVPRLFRPPKAIADGTISWKILWRRFEKKKIYFYSNTSANHIYELYSNGIALRLKAGLHFWNGEVVTFFISQIIRWKASAGEKVHCKINSGGESNSLKSLYVTAVHFIIAKLLQPYMKINFFLSFSSTPKYVGWGMPSAK